MKNSNQTQVVSESLQEKMNASSTTTNNDISTFASSNVSASPSVSPPMTTWQKSHEAANSPIDSGAAVSAAPSGESSYLRPKQTAEKESAPTVKEVDSPPKTVQSKETEASTQPQSGSSKSQQPTKSEEKKASKKEKKAEDPEQKEQDQRGFIPSITERNNQNVTNNRQSSGLFNFNQNGSGRAAKKGKVAKPVFGPDRINSLIDKCQELKQLREDLNHAINTGAPPKELKARVKKFESKFKDVSKDISRLGSKLESLSPESTSALNKAIGQDKFRSLNNHLTDVKGLMSAENLKSIGMEGSKALNEAMPKFNKSMEKMQQSIQAMIQSVSQSLSLGR